MAQKHRWQKGDRVRARILEIQAEGMLLVEIETQLFLVLNKSRHAWGIGHQIDLQVVSAHPLEFQVPDESRGFHRRI